MPPNLPIVILVDFALVGTGPVVRLNLLEPLKFYALIQTSVVYFAQISLQTFMTCFERKNIK